MKELSRYISEAFGEPIVESIGSEKIAKAFSNQRGKVMPYLMKNGPLGREMQWDKITDADVEEMGTEEARRLAYKKDSNVYVLWLDPQGRFQARTIGNYTTYMDYNLRRQVRDTVKSISMASDKALVIRDPDRFYTKELRAERTEQKKGALALMDAAQVAKDNLKRYRDILSQRKLQEFNLGDVVSRVQEFLKKYGEMVAKISSNLVVATDYREVTDALDDIETEMQRVMSDFKRVLSNKVDYDRWAKTPAIANDYRTRLLGALERLNQQIDEFYTKYIDDYAE